MKLTVPAEQIDRASKRYVVLSRKQKAYQKKCATRAMRRLGRRYLDDAPKTKRYRGWIG